MDFVEGFLYPILQVAVRVGPAARSTARRDVNFLHHEQVSSSSVFDDEARSRGSPAYFVDLLVAAEWMIVSHNINGHSINNVVILYVSIERKRVAINKGGTF